jgi:type III secretion system YscJ/HrcJ family lipoprotein
VGLLARVALLAIALLCAACGRVVLVHDVRRADAERIVRALAGAGIAAQPEQSEGASPNAGFDVDVARDDVARSMAVLAANELPRREQSGFAETYGTGSAIPTLGEERSRASQAVAGELARTLETWDGVISARVHVATVDPLAGSLDDASSPHARASVVLHVASGRPSPDVGAVQRLVAGAVAAMRPEDVTVVVDVRSVPRADAPVFMWFGPVAVASGSAGVMRAALAALIALFVVIVGVMVWLRRKAR